MTIQKLPVNSLNDEQMRRRHREVTNLVLTHQHDDSRVQTSAEKLARVTPNNFAYPPYHGLRYGIDPTGTNDSTDALQAAVDAAIKGYHHTVTLPHGIIRIDGTINVPEGVMIEGQGSQGSTESFGTVIMHHSTGNCFVWDGAGTAFAGTGGGLKNVLILKQTGFQGGYAIHIYATDDSHRPGEMFLENILVFGTGTGSWARCLNIDGTNAVTPGSAGVRSIIGHKIRVADCTDDNRYVSIENGIHCTFTHLQVDTGSAAGVVGMTIGNGSTNINLIGCVINGELDINDTATHINVQGRVSSFDQNNSSCIGTFVGTAPGGVRNNSKLFRIVCPEADDVFAYRTTDTTNVTGAGTAHTIVCTTERHDRNGNYDNATGIYTAFCAGEHQFNVAVTVDELAVANTSAILRFLHQTSGGGALDTVDVHWGNAGAMRDVGDSLTLHGAIMLDMAEGDLLTVQVIVSGGAGDTVDVIGRANTRYTWFSGKLLA